MSLENEVQQIFKESYMEHFFQFLKEDKKYLLLSEKIILAEKDILENPSKANKENLKKLKFQISEYMHIKIFEMGFFEGINYSRLRLKESLI